MRLADSLDGPNQIGGVGRDHAIPLVHRGGIVIQAQRHDPAAGRAVKERPQAHRLMLPRALLHDDHLGLERSHRLQGLAHVALHPHDFHAPLFIEDAPHPLGEEPVVIHDVGPARGGFGHHREETPVQDIRNIRRPAIPSIPQPARFR